MNIAGLVLAGGHSTRMQKDKTKLSILHNTSMLENAVALLSTVLPNEEVAISCREETRWDIDSRHISDIYKNMGPLGGIHAALTYLQKDLLILPTDLPLMNKELLLALFTAYKNDTSLHDMPLVYMYKNSQGDQAEPLVSIIRYTALDYIEEALLSQKKRVIMAVPQNKHRYLYYTHSEEDCFHNVNYPEDITRARELFRKHSLQ
ncbi:MAG: molybdenum cofactor guanylyltransferase [Desulfovibrionaceae bacterium]